MVCRQDTVAAGIKRPRPQDAEAAPASNMNGSAHTADTPAETAPAAMAAADAAPMSDTADTAAMDAAKAATQRADAILHNVSRKLAELEVHACHHASLHSVGGWGEDSK